MNDRFQTGLAGLHTNGFLNLQVNAIIVSESGL